MIKGLDKITTSTLFFIRPLGFEVKKLKKIGFINAFLEDSSYNIKYENAIYLLFKIEEGKEIEFDDFFNSVIESNFPLLLDEYAVGEEHVMLVFEFPKEFLKDKELVLEGKYSKLSAEFKELFPDFVESIVDGILIRDYSIYYRIFNKTEDLKTYIEETLGVKLEKDSEVWGIPNLEKEIFNNKILEDVK